MCDSRSEMSSDHSEEPLVCVTLARRLLEMRRKEIDPEPWKEGQWPDYA